MSHLEMLKLVSPEATVALAAFLILLADLAWLRRRAMPLRRAGEVILALAGCAAAALCLAWAQGPAASEGGVLIVDPLTQGIKLVLLAMAAFTALLFQDSDFTDHPAEFLALLLMATAAMMFMISSEDLLMIFLALEMASLCLYVMTGFNKRCARSAEAGLKYFLIGGTAAAFLLFGLSLLYGVTGHTNLRAIAASLPARPEPVFYLALVMIVAGLGFKVAAVPFHLWAPDAYQAAPIPGAALIASSSKVASFFVLARFTMTGFGAQDGLPALGGATAGWMPLLAWLAALSMLLGNLAAIVQKSVRRLLAFSAVAQAGYMLVGLLADGPQGLAALVYYAATYGLTLIGAFGVVAVVQARSGSDDLAAFAGLSRRAPVLSLCLLVFMLSLAGIPPLAGFFGKFYLFTAALKAHGKDLGVLWLIIFAIAMSAVSLYYYLQVLKQVYVAEAAEHAEPLPVAFSTRLAVVLLAVLVILFGCVPGLLLDRLLPAIQAAGF